MGGVSNRLVAARVVQTCYGGELNTGYGGELKTCYVGELNTGYGGELNAHHFKRYCWLTASTKKTLHCVFVVLVSASCCKLTQA